MRRAFRRVAWFLRFRYPELETCSRTGHPRLKLFWIDRITKEEVEQVGKTALQRS